MLVLIHLDLIDFEDTINKCGKKVLHINFVDDSRYITIYLLKSKDDIENLFLRFKVEVENQLDRKIKRLDGIGAVNISLKF